MTYAQFLLFIRFQTVCPPSISVGRWRAMVSQAKLNGDIIDESQSPW